MLSSPISPPKPAPPIKPSMLSASMKAASAVRPWRQYSGSARSLAMRRGSASNTRFQPAPVVVHQQEARIRLGVVVDAELDEAPLARRDRQPVDEELDEAVVAELREHAELGLLEIEGGGLPDLVDEQPAGEDLRVGKLLRKRHHPSCAR